MGLMNWLGTGITMFRDALFQWAEVTGVYIQQVIDIVK